MSPSYFSSTLQAFLRLSENEIIGVISKYHSQKIVAEQRAAWAAQVQLLKRELTALDEDGHIFFEFMIPRMGRRADVVLVYRGIIFVIEFKVNATSYLSADLRQTHGYALDLKNFHRGSHEKAIIPCLVATAASTQLASVKLEEDGVAAPLKLNGQDLGLLISQIAESQGAPAFDAETWAVSGYLPTPTIVEAAQALYANHAVEDISRNEADATNLSVTSKSLLALIHQARLNSEKIICFVTGVPGAGKTLVGLNIASEHSNPNEKEYSVFLSGNHSLVVVLQEALARDRAAREGIGIGDARRQTSQFIQNIHKFRDSALDGSTPPEKVAVFDEAQRAWNKEQASKFMRQKRGKLDFDQSEPEFLIEVMDRHKDWAVIVALIGGGQEINTGEVGLAGWLNALEGRFNNWKAYCSPELFQAEYVSDGITQDSLAGKIMLNELHLSTSMRSFRSSDLSSFVHHVVAGNAELARSYAAKLEGKYPILVTRDLAKAKAWVKSKARATESAGLLASSNGLRLKPDGIFVKNTIEPQNWFLGDVDDVRSSHFLEDVATEFDVQGLELDWCVVAWDADYRYAKQGFEHWRFHGSRWQHRNSEDDKRYLENAYRVLLTRARQGMVVYVPAGDDDDATRLKGFYDATYSHLGQCGFRMI
ncbi:MAG: DUF2075 domain-containing protein [Alcanivoracaceae bacterium]|nr:DUF2075 domain-containing protein [Alcanivoracaceae bacterium]